MATFSRDYLEAQQESTELRWPLLRKPSPLSHISQIVMNCVLFSLSKLQSRLNSSAIGTPYQIPLVFF
jgi:hypothetical protein